MFYKKSPTKDSDGANMVDIDWSYSKKDIQSISKYLKLLDKEIREKIGKFFIKISTKINFSVIFYIHILLYNKNGSSERNSVCDKFGQIHGISNL